MSKKRPLLIFDWDCTLAEPTDRGFYAQHRQKTKQALINHFNITAEAMENISSELEENNIRLEKLFFSTSLALKFNLESAKLGQYEQLKHSLNQISPEEWFEQDAGLVKTLRRLKDHYDIVILSNSPEHLIREIGNCIGFDMDNDFMAIYGLTSAGGPPKYTNAEDAFDKILKAYKPDISRSWSLGDSSRTDLDPAQKRGLKTALIDNIGQHDKNTGYSYHGPLQDVIPRLLHP